ELYEKFAQRGVSYGPYFQSVDRVYLGVSESLGRVRVPLICRRTFDQYRLHPSLFDGALQIAGATALGSGELRLPFNVDALEIPGNFDTEMWIYVRGDTNADLLICNDDGRVAAKLSGYATR